MTNRALAFTIHQRPFYTASTLKAWAAVRGLDEWDISFHIDPSDQSFPQLVHIEQFAWESPSNVEWEVNEERLGVLKNPLKALRHAFSNPEVEYAVLAEEDVEVGNDVLEYLDFALPRSDIACAWSDGDGPENEVTYRKWFTPWIWGTNREVFTEILEPTWDTDYSTGDERGPAGWDCHIGLRLVHEMDLKIAFPRSSRSRHVGKWLGVHQAPGEYGIKEDPLSFAASRPPQEWRFSDGADNR